MCNKRYILWLVVDCLLAEMFWYQDTEVTR
jgi:hypothetical protein